MLKENKLEKKDFKVEEGIYIPNIEACWLYKAKIENENGNYPVEDKFLNKLLAGKIDYSYELIANKELVENIEIYKTNNGKQFTLDIVNVKFTKKYKKIENKEVVEEVTTGDLRDMIYEDGFMFNSKEMKNWKRSGGKARNGEDLFLLKDIKDKCLDWARMGLKFIGDVDISSIRAYESLPLSSIHGGTININPKNILVIDDINSAFNCKMSRTWLDGEELQTQTEIVEESNSLFDGEGLLSKEKFTGFLEGKGVALLRNRLMKCAGFSCDIQQFYIDYCDKHKLKYDEFKVKDMYGNTIFAKDIELITTPSALKIQKYNSEVIKKEGYEGKGAWLEYWKDNCSDIFAVCKYDKPSHNCIFNKDGSVEQYRNVLSYQMINTISFTEEELNLLVAREIKYVDKLKNDIDFFLDETIKGYVKIEEDELNEDGTEKEIDTSIVEEIKVDTAFAKLCKKHKGFMNTRVFKDFRRNSINAYIKRLRQGKIHVIDSDYAIVCGNPIEMLYSTIGEFTGESIALKDNELFCNRFEEDGQEVTGFRSPHIMISNVGNMINKDNELIRKYMACTDNVVYVNAINTPVNSQFSGMDYDIDAILLVGDKLVVEPSKRADKNIYPIMYNDIKNTGSNNKEMTAINMSKNDKVISQNYIGQVVNTSQLLNSLMNDMLYIDKNADITKIYNDISKMNSTSNVEIDKAKKQFENLNVSSEIAKIKATMEVVDEDKVKSTRLEMKGFYKQLEGIKADRKEKRKEVTKEIRKIRKQLKADENNINLQNALNEKINDREEINVEEIKMIKENILECKLKLSELDTRILKPLFMKYIGDNDAKEQMRKTNKAHLRALNDVTKAKGLSEKEELEELEKNKEIQKVWENKIYRPLNTPMDWLELQIDKIQCKKDKSDTIQVIQLIKKSKHKANEETVKSVVEFIKNTDTKIKGYKADNELQYNDRKNKINLAKKECCDFIKDSKLKKVDLYGVLKECLNSVKKNGKLDNTTGIESLTLELLFEVFGNIMYEMFAQ